MCIHTHGLSSSLNIAVDAHRQNKPLFKKRNNNFVVPKKQRLAVTNAPGDSFRTAVIKMWILGLL